MTSMDKLNESPPFADPLVSLTSPSRLATLDSLEILDVPSERSFAMLTELAADLLHAEVALVSLVTDERQYFSGAYGLGQVCPENQTPLTHSFCQHVVTRNEPLIISDARIHDLVRNNSAISDLGVISYLGVPIIVDDEYVGAFCLINSQPRDWTETDLESLGRFAAITSRELIARKEARTKHREAESRIIRSQKLEAIGRLTSGIAHDFNNVLGTIQIYAELLRPELQDNTQALESVRNILQSVDCASDVVSELVKWNAPGDGKKRRLALSDTIAHTIPMLKALLPPKAQLHFDHSHDSSAVILANKAQIHQVLLNLCSNAAYAVRTAGGTINVAVETTDKSVLLNVMDDGCGMPESTQQRLFDPYFSTKATGEGTGLGLWTVHEIVRDHGATIQVESVEQVGTRISIEFPRAHQIEATDTDERRDPIIVKARHPNHILVVDDDIRIVDGITRQLTLAGHDVTPFDDSRAALEYVRANADRIDLLFTDQRMPHFTGEQLAELVKCIRPNLPVIICTGHHRSVGNADRYLAKPFQFEDLLSLIDQVMEKRQAK